MLNIRRGIGYAPSNVNMIFLMLVPSLKLTDAMKTLNIMDSKLGHP